MRQAFTGPRLPPRSTPTARRWRQRYPASAWLAPEHARVIRIKNTAVLGENECSEAFLPAIAECPDLGVVEGQARPLGFDAGGRIAPRRDHSTDQGGPTDDCSDTDPLSHRRACRRPRRGEPGGRTRPVAGGPHLLGRSDRRHVDPHGRRDRRRDQEEVPRARRAGRAGRRPRQHGEDPQRQGRYRLVDDHRARRRARGRERLEGQADRQGVDRRELLPQRVAARRPRRQRRAQDRGPQGQGGGPAAPRQHQPRRRGGRRCSGSSA